MRSDNQKDMIMSNSSGPVGIRNSEEFVPKLGYEVPDLQKSLVLRTQEAEVRLSERRLAELSSSDVCKILQVRSA